MKILLTLFVLLFYSSLAFAEISLGKLKLNDTITNHFSREEIINLEWKGSREQYGIDKKYSLILINNPKETLRVNYDTVVIAYESNSWKIHYVSGFVLSLKSLNSCIEFSNNQILIYNNELTHLFREEGTSEHTELGQKQKIISFSDDKKFVKFGCDYRSDADTVNFRFDFSTTDFNSWVVESEGTKRLN